MSAARTAKVAVAVMWVLIASAPVRAGPPPDAWSGIVTLNWSSQLPENSPLRKEVDRIFVDAHIEWTMWVHFKRELASKRGVMYTVQSATVDYLEVSHHDARGRRGDATMRTLQTERLEASGRVLDSRACNLVLWVNYTTKAYWIDVGGFKLEDVPRSGQVLIEVTDANGTRRVSDPTTGDRDVIKPVRFEGRYTERKPEILSGTFDANVEPPPGVDLSYETIGGMVEWSLFRGACPEVEEACMNDAESTLQGCGEIVQGVYGLDCNLDEIAVTCVSLERDCVKSACSFVEGYPLTDSAFEAGIDALIDCWDEHLRTFLDCLDLCP